MAAILVALALSAGLPFVALSTTSVVAQAWFTTTRHPKRSDPYFLYGLSNAGALLALLTYPFLIEPNLTLPSQLLFWYAGYGVYVLLNAWCVRQLDAADDDGTAPAPTKAPLAPPPAPSARVSWLLLSASANALLMVVTAVISMDAPVPLVWILPLTLYLLTLIVCFAPTLPSERAIRMWNLSGMAVAALFLLAMFAGVRPEYAVFGVQNAVLFVACMMVHDRLVRSKPADPRHLGTYFLSISLGGWLGSVTIGIATPLAFGWLASHSADFAVAGVLLLSAFAAKDVPGLARVVEVEAHSRTGGGRRGARRGLGAGRRRFEHAAAAQCTRRARSTAFTAWSRRAAVACSTTGTPCTVSRASILRAGASRWPTTTPAPRSVASSRPTTVRPSVGIVGLGVGTLAAYRRPGQALGVLRDRSRGGAHRARMVQLPRAGRAGQPRDPRRRAPFAAEDSRCSLRRARDGHVQQRLRAAAPRHGRGRRSFTCRN